MIHGFPIDFIRQALEQTLLEQHKSNPDLFGGKDQVNIFSLYEQLAKGDDVDRYVENLREIADQQNKTDLILNGVLLAPTNPTITNLYSCTNIPMEWVCSLRCTLANRDQALGTLNNLIEELKGSKVDIAELKCVSEKYGTAYKPFVVGTIGHNEGEPQLKIGDYIGDFDLATDIPYRLDALAEQGLYNQGQPNEGDWYYAGELKENGETLRVAYFDGETWVFLEDDGTYPEIIFPPEHADFKKYKLSMSCEAIRCDEPYTLNGEEYVKISFGGSATLTNYSVLFGNDLVKVCIEKYGIKLKTGDIVYNPTNKYWLEPLEMPSSNDPNTRINQLVSNNFKSNTHTDAIALTLQYTFLLDLNIKLLEQWFEYGRYGTTNVGDSVGSSYYAMSPNIIYKVTEYWSYWGNVRIRDVKAKISNSIDIEDTESDTMTVGVVMQIQGDND